MIVYLITNKVNGKQYVGKTVGSLQRRWWEHKSDAKHRSNTPLHNAIRKYGPDSFKISVLRDLPDHESTLAYECYYIAHYELLNRDKGYNRTEGGDGAIGYRHTEESLQKMRQPRGSMSLEARQAISRATKGVPKPIGRQNKPWTEERRAAVRKTWERKRCGTNLMSPTRAVTVQFLADR